MTAQRRVLFLALGRRGAVPKLALDIARALPSLEGVAGFVAVPSGSETVDEVSATGRALVVETFASAAGLLRLDRLIALRRQLARFIESERVDTVIVLMPHVWTPLVAGAVKRTGARYVVVVHDAEAHPGDTTGLVTDWLLRDARAADEVVTLSAHVFERLVARSVVPLGRIRALFLPAFDYAASGAAPVGERPFGLLFFGRILAYKGLDLMVEAAEILRDRGVPLRWGVAGAGELGALRPRLEALGAEIINRWIDDGEVGAILSRYDAMVLPYIEASQSGVAAAAIGAGLPLVATPVGGLIEQVEGGQTGLLAERVDAQALAAAIARLAFDPALQGRLRAGVAAARAAGSVEQFLRALLRLPAGKA